MASDLGEYEGIYPLIAFYLPLNTGLRFSLNALMPS
jgi:hypothetical protein